MKTTADVNRQAYSSVIKMFNGSLRDGCLNLHWFESLMEAKHAIDVSRWDYDETRPHMALNKLMAGEFVRVHSLRPTAEGSSETEH